MLRFLFYSIATCICLVQAIYSQTLDNSNWDKRFGIPGVNGIVNAIAINGDEVIVGGNFSVAGNINTSSIAVWNKRYNQWNPLNNGLSGGSVNAITVYKDVIYVAGNFKYADRKKVSPVVKWDNGTWTSLADSITPIDSANIRALHIKNDSLFVGGLFNGINNNSSQNLAVYSILNKDWRTFENGTDGAINAITSDEGGLYVGGDFIFVGETEVNNLAKLVRGRWESIGEGTQGVIHSLLFYNNNLYAGGGFVQAGTNTVAYGIARWSGNRWFALGRGIEGLFVSSILPFGKDILITGGFSVAGTDTVNNVAIWDGAKWSKAGSGTTGIINAAAVDDDTTLFCGGFFAQAGGTYSDHIAIMKNKSWTNFSNKNTNGYFQDITAISQGKKKLYVAGSLDEKGSTTRTVAEWNGNSWRTLPFKFHGGNVKSMIVDTINANNDVLFIAGDFTKIDNNNVPPIMVWSGKWFTIPTNISGKINTICKFQNKIYAGGEFIIDNDSTKKNIAYLNFSTSSNDTAKWQLVAKGSDSVIHSVAVDKTGTLYCGGNFKSISGVGLNNIAMLKNNEFMPLTEGCDSTVLALYIGVENELIVGGEFKNAGGKNSPCLAFFDGKQWYQPISKITGTDPKVSCITQTSNGIIYIGGNFDSVDLVAAKSVAKYDRGFWKGLGSGLTGRSSSVHDTQTEIKAIANNNEFLYIGGDFSHAGDSPSSAFAIWNAYLTDVKPEPKDNYRDNVIKLFPNPAKNYLNIYRSDNLTSDFFGSNDLKSNLQVEVYNSLFEKIITTEASIYNGYIKIDVSELTDGGYTIILKNQDKKFIFQKFIIAK